MEDCTIWVKVDETAYTNFLQIDSNIEKWNNFKNLSSIVDIEDNSRKLIFLELFFANLE